MLSHYYHIIMYLFLLINFICNIQEWFVLPLVAVPRVDGDFLPDHPSTLLASGSFNHVDIISGFTRDEGISSALGKLCLGPF